MSLGKTLVQMGGAGRGGHLNLFFFFLTIGKFPPSRGSLCNPCAIHTSAQVQRMLKNRPRFALGPPPLQV